MIIRIYIEYRLDIVRAPTLKKSIKGLIKCYILFSKGSGRVIPISNLLTKTHI